MATVLGVSYTKSCEMETEVHNMLPATHGCQIYSDCHWFELRWPPSIVGGITGLETLVPLLLCGNFAAVTFHDHNSTDLC